MAPVFQGVGFSAICVNAFIGFYYNGIIAYCFYYFLFSMRSELLWKNCGSEIDCFKANENKSINCSEQLAPYREQNSKLIKPR